MPVATTALGSAIIGAGFFAGASPFLVGLAAQTAIGLALYALSPKPKLGGAGGYLVTASGSNLNHQVIYGRTRVAGVRVFDHTKGGDTNKFLHRVIAFAGHEIEDFEEVWINEYRVKTWQGTASGDDEGNVLEIEDKDGNAPEDFGADIYDGFIDIHKEYGTPDQAVNNELKARVGDDVNAPDWDSTYRLRGIAYLYIRMKYNPDVFPDGIPEITATIKGKKVIDPREFFQIPRWSDNPALCLRDYLTNESYGLGEPEVNIDDSYFVSAANRCEETATVVEAGDSAAGLGTTYFTCNGAFTTESPPADIIEGLLSSMAGLAWFSQGTWRIKAAQYVAPTLTLTEDDVVDHLRVSTRHSRRDNFNGVRGTFKGPRTNWQVTDFPPVDNGGAFVTIDNDQESWVDLQLPFTDNSSTARRIGRIVLEQNRQQITVEGKFSIKAFRLQIGDTVGITNSRFGWSAKEFEVTGWSFGLEEDMSLPVSMTLRETASSVYDEVDDGIVYEQDNTTLASAFTVETPVMQTPVVTNRLQPDGTSIEEVTYTWTVSNDNDIAYYEFEWKFSSDSEYKNTQVVNGKQYVITPAVNNTSYDARARAVSYLGVRSPYSSALATSTGKDATIPNPPTSLAASPGYASVLLTWTAPTQNTDGSDADDIKGYQVYRETSQTGSPSNLLGFVSATAFGDTGLADETTYWYYVYAVDYSGNTSSTFDEVSATTLTAPAGQDGQDGQDGSDAPRTPARYTIVVPVDELPATTASQADLNDDYFEVSGYVTPLENDILWYNGYETVGEVKEQRVWIYTTGQWEYQVKVFDGNLLVTRSVSADKVRIDGTTLDTDDNGNIIIAKDGVNFTQLVDESATTFDDFSLSQDTENNTTYFYNHFITMQHDGVCTILANFDVQAQYQSDAFSRFAIWVDGFLVLETERTSGSTHERALLETVTLSEGDHRITYRARHDDFNLNSSGNRSVTVYAIALQRYR